jgi:hypothetical protein
MISVARNGGDGGDLKSVLGFQDQLANHRPVDPACGCGVSVQRFLWRGPVVALASVMDG